MFVWWVRKTGLGELLPDFTTLLLAEGRTPHHLPSTVAIMARLIIAQHSRSALATKLVINISVDQFNITIAMKNSYCTV